MAGPGVRGGEGHDDVRLHRTEAVGSFLDGGGRVSAQRTYMGPTGTQGQDGGWWDRSRHLQGLRRQSGPGGLVDEDASSAHVSSKRLLGRTRVRGTASTGRGGWDGPRVHKASNVVAPVTTGPGANIDTRNLPANCSRRFASGPARTFRRDVRCQPHRAALRRHRGDRHYAQCPSPQTTGEQTRFARARQPTPQGTPYYGTIRASDSRGQR